MTIGSKKFKELKEKIISLGFSDKMKDGLKYSNRRMHSEGVKLNMSRLAKELDLYYPTLRLELNKEGRMSKEWASKIEDKIKEIKLD